MPILNNGFIADDYVILQRIELLKTQPLYLYQVPPENFRLISYVIFGTLKALVGYQAAFFYAFNIGLHLVNIVLLARLLKLLVKDETTARLAVLLFAVFQAPQEAIMWLAAMNETTLFFFTVLALLFWLRGHYIAATLASALALFSKESAVLIPILILLLDLYCAKGIQWRKYVVLCIPSAGFLAIFAVTVAKNFMLTTGSYAFGPHALVVLGITVHRLLWPWFYIIFLLVSLKTRRLPQLPMVGAYLGVVIVTMLPYIFIAYQSSMPSRQLYLASAVLMTMFAALLKPLRGTHLLGAIVLAFLTYNVGYLWLRKDGQFEQRAAPTTQLINVLRLYRPQKTVIRKFAYPLPEIATAATMVVPGWAPGLVSVDVNCEGCLQLEWDQNNRQYQTVERH